MMRARGERSTVPGLGRRNDVRQVASPGSSERSRRSISASTRCSSIDSAIRPPPRRALREYSLTIPQERSLSNCSGFVLLPVFAPDGRGAVRRLTSAHEAADYATFLVEYRKPVKN